MYKLVRKTISLRSIRGRVMASQAQSEEGSWLPKLNQSLLLQSETYTPSQLLPSPPPGCCSRFATKSGPHTRVSSSCIAAKKTYFIKRWTALVQQTSETFRATWIAFKLTHQARTLISKDSLLEQGNGWHTSTE